MSVLGLSHRLVVYLSTTQTAPTAIYTLSLHDALPISRQYGHVSRHPRDHYAPVLIQLRSRTVVSTHLTNRSLSTCSRDRDRKSTRLNSSHSQISYAVFCLKKKTRCLSRRARLSSRI